jgi:hypothetical protein
MILRLGNTDTTAEDLDSLGYAHEYLSSRRKHTETHTALIGQQG